MHSMYSRCLKGERTQVIIKEKVTRRMNEKFSSELNFKSGEVGRIFNLKLHFLLLKWNLRGHNDTYYRLNQIIQVFFLRYRNHVRFISFPHVNCPTAGPTVLILQEFFLGLGSSKDCSVYFAEVFINIDTIVSWVSPPSVWSEPSDLSFSISILLIAVFFLRKFM